MDDPEDDDLSAAYAALAVQARACDACGDPAADRSTADLNRRALCRECRAELSGDLGPAIKYVVRVDGQRRRR